VSKLVVVAALLLGACVADDTSMPTIDRDEANVDVNSVETDANALYCSLAQDLPSTDMCSLICDPDSFKARLLDDGMKSGNCYQLRCNLSPEVSVTVGVCLP